MKILVLKSSGNKHGSSNMLADEFIRGAKETAIRSRNLMCSVQISGPASAATTAVWAVPVFRRTTTKTK